MRFMILMIPAVYQNGKVDSNFVPPADKMEAMGKFNDKLQKAGVLLSLDGLHPLSSGTRLHFSGGKAKVTDGPFVEAKEVLGGYWMIQTASKEEAVNWMKSCPADDGDIIEIRPIFEMSDFPNPDQKAVKR